MNNDKMKTTQTEFKAKTGFFNWLFSKDDYSEYAEIMKVQTNQLKSTAKK